MSSGFERSCARLWSVRPIFPSTGMKADASDTVGEGTVTPFVWRERHESSKKRMLLQVIKSIRGRYNVFCAGALVLPSAEEIPSSSEARR